MLVCGFIGFADKKCEGPIKTTYRPRCPIEKNAMFSLFVI
jgi:hypothetical protein